MKLLSNLNGTLSVLSKLVYPIKYSKRGNASALSNTAIGNVVFDNSLNCITKG